MFHSIVQVFDKTVRVTKSPEFSLFDYPIWVLFLIFLVYSCRFSIYISFSCYFFAIFICYHVWSFICYIAVLSCHLSR